MRKNERARETRGEGSMRENERKRGGDDKRRERREGGVKANLDSTQTQKRERTRGQIPIQPNHIE